MSTIQMNFFDKIIAMYEKKGDAVASFEIILNLGKDAVYRRIRNETLLNPDEFVALAKAHNISIDQLIDLKKNDVLFTFNPFSNKVNDVDDYIDTLIDTVQQLKYIHNGHVLYASSEIPVFYQAMVPSLFSFKLYVWARTVWNLPAFQNVPFSFDLISRTVTLKYKEIFELYKTLPSTELWSSGIFENTFSQIEYHLDTNKFKNPQDAIHLLNEIETLCNHMLEMANIGIKFEPGSNPDLGSSLKLYHNEMVYTNNTILFISKHLKLIFSTICNPNFIYSRDNKMCDFVDNWFHTVMNKSVLISEINEKERIRFFDRIKRKIDIMRKKIEIKFLEQY
jgi:hypothetical protein